MKITLEIKDINELYQILKYKEELKKEYDYLRFSKENYDYRLKLGLKNKLEIIDKLIENYLSLNEDVKEILCTKDTIVEVNEKVVIPVNINNLSEYDFIFRGYVALRGMFDIYYDQNIDLIFAENNVPESQMRKSKMPIENYSKIDSSVCFYPGRYKIKKGDILGIAKVKEKVKTLK